MFYLFSINRLNNHHHFRIVRNMRQSYKKFPSAIIGDTGFGETLAKNVEYKKIKATTVTVDRTSVNATNSSHERSSDCKLRQTENLRRFCT
jgi:hypothetical protein